MLYQYKHALCHRFCKGMDSRAHVYKTSSFYYVQQHSVLYQYKHERGAAGGDHFISYVVTRAKHEVIISYLTR